ncbi:hypothetical protein [Persicirhabdus sediminis]|uniref:Uncharacterized protein n=1 Tax=Persicirhabdus sediminis TaxID=454144 RepID=A0A8J7MH26_9BACT|nr:hypothetical protein [Persicirhabdus sediminis]MBK1791704.1 hypothetical protein [Persicirhabdus sediminis]
MFIVDLEERLEDIKGKRKFIDIVCGYENSNTYCAIELKFKTKKQAAQNLGRIDAYIDIEAVELATEKKEFSLGYFFMITDASEYIKPSRSGVGTRFQLHEGASITPGEYNTRGLKCAGRENVKLELKGSYKINWDVEKKWHFLCLPIK